MNINERLKYARERAGLTLAQVKNRTGIGESSLSEFENARREPKLSHLNALARAYRRSLGFFLDEGPIEREVVLWRERPEEEPKEIEALFLRLCEQYHNLEVWCGDQLDSWLPEVRASERAFTYGDAEQLAHRVHGELQLGDRPGPELLRVLEEACGVKVFHWSFKPTGTAASTKSPTFGYAILLNKENVRWRRNFDLAHELFHLLTWEAFRSQEDASSCVAEPTEEKLATCFARNLLMPPNALRLALQRRMREGQVTFEALFDIAREFDVSTEALLWHIHFLYNRGQEGEEMTKREIQKADSLSDTYEERQNTVPPKRPARYHALAVKALRHGEMSIGRFAEYLDVSRQKAMTYIEQEAENGEGIQVAPARC